MDPEKLIDDTPFWKCTGTNCQINSISVTQKLLEVDVKTNAKDIVSEIYVTTSPDILVEGQFSARIEIEDHAGDFFLEKLHYGIVDQDETFHYMTVKHNWFPGSLKLNFFPNSLDYSVFKKFKNFNTQIKHANRARLILRVIGSSFKFKIHSIEFNLKELDKDTKFLYLNDKDILHASNEIDVINSYFPWKEKYVINLDEFRSGNYKLPDSNVFRLEKDGAFPKEISSNPSFQRQYHSLELVKVILLDSKKNGSTDWHVEKSLDIVMKWIKRDYLKVSDDYKYAWYDHSVADRCIVLMELYIKAAAKASRGVKKILSGVIVSHIQLLASPVFYLRNQKYPYHNHGLFQDLALLISCSSLDSPGTKKTKKLAEDRMMLQLSNLVSNEGVSVENSGGYHKGLKKILSNILDTSENIISEVNRDKIRLLSNKMEKFMSDFFYPDGTSPAYGDTFNSIKSKVVKEEEISLGYHFFPLSGYFSHRTEIENIGLVQINMYNSSLSKIHKHNDNLQITLWASGEEVFVDPGLSGYSENDPDTKSCRLAKNHNLFYPLGYATGFPNDKAAMTEINGDWGRGVISSSDMFKGTETSRSLIVDKQKGIYRIIDWCTKSEEGTFRLNLRDGVIVQKFTDSVRIDTGGVVLRVDCQTVTGERLAPHIVDAKVYFGHIDRRSCSAIEFYTKETPIITTIAIGLSNESVRNKSFFTREDILQITNM